MQCYVRIIKEKSVVLVFISFKMKMKENGNGYTTAEQKRVMVEENYNRK